MIGVLFASANIFFAFLLGAVAFVFCGLNFPETFAVLEIGAQSVRQFIVNDIGLPVAINFPLKFLLQEFQFVFIFFVILARIAIAFFGWWVESMFGQQSNSS